MNAAGGNTIEEIEKVEHHGAVIYKAEWEANGRDVEIKLSPEGKILKKASGDEDDDENGNDEDDDDNDNED